MSRLWPSFERVQQLYRGVSSVKRVDNPIGPGLLCGSVIGENCIVVGTFDGRVCMYAYDGGDRLEPKWTYHFAANVKQVNAVSVTMEGPVVALSSYSANHMIVIENPTSLKSIHAPNIPLPINASSADDAGRVIVATSANYDPENPEYAFAAYTQRAIGRFEVDQLNDEMYCEVVKRYGGTDTPYFKRGGMYGQFRRWDKQQGYIHPIDGRTSPKTAYKVPSAHVPLIFDFVIDIDAPPSLVLITNAGLILHVELITNSVLRRWRTALNDKMPGVCCHRDAAFVTASTNAIIHFESDDMETSDAQICVKLDGGLLLI